MYYDSPKEKKKVYGNNFNLIMKLCNFQNIAYHVQKRYRKHPLLKSLVKIATVITDFQSFIIFNEKSTKTELVLHNKIDVNCYLTCYTLKSY